MYAGVAKGHRRLSRHARIKSLSAQKALREQKRMAIEKQRRASLSQAPGVSPSPSPRQGPNNTLNPAADPQGASRSVPAATQRGSSAKPGADSLTKPTHPSQVDTTVQQVLKDTGYTPSIPAPLNKDIANIQRRNYSSGAIRSDTLQVPTQATQIEVAQPQHSLPSDERKGKRGIYQDSSAPKKSRLADASTAAKLEKSAIQAGSEVELEADPDVQTNGLATHIQRKGRHAQDLAGKSTPDWSGQTQETFVPQSEKAQHVPKCPEQRVANSKPSNHQTEDSDNSEEDSSDESTEVEADVQTAGQKHMQSSRAPEAIGQRSPKGDYFSISTSLFPRSPFRILRYRNAIMSLAIPAQLKADI